MSEERLTLGQAIDAVVKALAPFDGPDQQTILNAVCSHLKVAQQPALAPQSSMAPVATSNGAFSTPVPQSSASPLVAFDAGIDIKSLKNEKKPTSASQMACVVAFYLAELAPAAERKSTVKVADMDRFFREAKFKLPEKLEQLLVDAKKAGYFEAVGRGEYKLTRVGYNLVTQSMPRKAVE